MTDDAEKQGLFEQIRERNQGRLWSVARHYAPGDETRDLYQEIVLALWKSRDGFQGRSQIDTWVYRVALHTAMAYARRAMLRTNRTSDAGAAILELPANPGVDRESQILKEFIRSLDPMDRAILHLHLENTTPADMSEITGLSEGNVRVRFSRIRKRYVEQYLKA